MINGPEEREILTTHGQQAEPGAPQGDQPSMRVIGSAILLPLSVFTLYAGAVDSLTATSLIPRLLGAALIPASLTMWAGLWGLFRGGKRGRTVALVGACIGACIGLLMLGVQVAGLDIDWRLAVWLMMLVLPASFAVILLQSGTRAGIPQGIRTAFSLTLVIGLFQFWYTNEYLPAKDHGIDLQARLERPAGEGLPRADSTQRLMPLQATVTYKNLSQVRKRIVGSNLALYGARVLPYPSTLTETAFRDKLATTVIDGDTRANLYAEYSSLTLVAAEPFFVTQGNFVDPGKEFSQTSVHYVAEGEYEIVLLTVKILTANGDALQLESSSGFTDSLWEGKKAVLGTWRIKESSFLSRITRDRRYLHANYVYGNEWNVYAPKYGNEWNYPGVRVFIDRTPGNRKFEDLKRDKFVTRMADLYGLVNSNTYVQLSL